MAEKPDNADPEQPSGTTTEGAAAPSAAPSHHAGAAGSGTVDMQAMAHELRTPIGAILALAEMIEREQFGPLGDPRYAEYARDIRDSASLTLGIVSNALEDDDAATSASLLGDLVEVNPTDVIQKCLRTVQHTAGEAGVRMIVELKPELPLLIASAPALTQILLNLLTNAIKFTPQHGSVTVSATATQAEGLIITVTDTGVGMTGTEASVLIAEQGAAHSRPPGSGAEPHIDTANIQSRNGIGFSLVRRLTRAMSADFSVESARGVGTSIRLRFPTDRLVPATQP